jgi:hypothetical protein
MVDPRSGRMFLNSKIRSARKRGQWGAAADRCPRDGPDWQLIDLVVEAVRVKLAQRCTAVLPRGSRDSVAPLITGGASFSATTPRQARPRLARAASAARLPCPFAVLLRSRILALQKHPARAQPCFTKLSDENSLRLFWRVGAVLGTVFTLNVREGRWFRTRPGDERGGRDSASRPPGLEHAESILGRCRPSAFLHIGPPLRVVHAIEFYRRMQGSLAAMSRLACLSCASISFISPRTS